MVTQNPGLRDLQARLHHRFADAALLQRALTHRSFSADHNERLEFLGDSVLNLAVAHLLYEALTTPPKIKIIPVKYSHNINTMTPPMLP